MEKFETEERRKLPESDVLLGTPVLDFHEAEDAKYRSGHGGKSK